MIFLHLLDRKNQNKLVDEQLNNDIEDFDDNDEFGSSTVGKIYDQVSIRSAFDMPE